MSMQNFPVNWMGRGETPHTLPASLCWAACEIKGKAQGNEQVLAGCAVLWYWVQEPFWFQTKKHVSLEGLPYIGKILNWLENWFILGCPVSIVEASVMKLPIKLEFNSDPVPWAGWELVLFTKTQRKSASEKSSHSQLCFTRELVFLYLDGRVRSK